MNQIRYCYQRVVVRNPTIAGKASFQFVIESDGAVSTAGIQTTTLGNQSVESCIAGRFRRFKFPQPKNGKKVDVNISFLFQP